MKALSFSKLAFVCALVLGVMVFWAAAAPSATGADSAIGGWILGGGDCPCEDEKERGCSEGPPETQPHCNPAYETWVCITTSENPPERCTPKEGPGYDQCDYGAHYDCPGWETRCE